MNVGTIHKNIGKELEQFGGYLECTVCNRKQELGDIGSNLKTGWPKCHGYTMRWITANELQRSRMDSALGGKDE